MISARKINNPQQRANLHFFENHVAVGLFEHQKSQTKISHAQHVRHA